MSPRKTHGKIRCWPPKNQVMYHKNVGLGAMVEICVCSIYKWNFWSTFFWSARYTWTLWVDFRSLNLPTLQRPPPFDSLDGRRGPENTGRWPRKNRFSRFKYVFRIEFFIFCPICGRRWSSFLSFAAVLVYRHQDELKSKTASDFGILLRMNSKWALKRWGPDGPWLCRVSRGWSPTQLCHHVGITLSPMK